MKINFHTRYCSADEHNDILGNTNLFFLNSPAWNDLRTRLTPLFSSGKMKRMFHLMKSIGDQLSDIMRCMDINQKTNSFCVDVKELCTRYTIDVIASCAYGIEANSLKIPTGDFVTYGKKIFEFKIFRAIEFFAVFFFPEIVRLFRFKVRMTLILTPKCIWCWPTKLVTGFFQRNQRLLTWIYQFCIERTWKVWEWASGLDRHTANSSKRG